MTAHDANLVVEDEPIAAPSIARLTTPVVTRSIELRPALADVAKSRSLALVINEDVGLIAWADPSLDITPVVVDALVKSEAPPPR